MLGYEANYAGTSFVDAGQASRQASSTAATRSTSFADQTQPGSLGAVGYDDEGVKTKSWDLIKDGILVNYQTHPRPGAHRSARTTSHGCCYADSWSSVQFQRMPNVSLLPGKAS